MGTGASKRPNTLPFTKIKLGTSALFETAINREDHSSGAIMARNGRRVSSIQEQYREGTRRTRETKTNNIRMTADVSSQHFHGENIQKGEQGISLTHPTGRLERARGVTIDKDGAAESLLLIQTKESYWLVVLICQFNYIE